MPNMRDDWDGPTVKHWNKEKNWFSYDDTLLSDWNRFGIVGCKSEYKLFTIDIDVYDMKESDVRKLHEVIPKLPRTLMHKSKNGGIHIFYLVDESELDDGKVDFQFIEGIDNKLNGFVLSPYHCGGYGIILQENICKIELDDLPSELIKEEKKSSFDSNKVKRSCIDINKRVREIYASNRKFRELFNGSSSGYDTRSEADYALLGMLKSRGFTRSEAKYVMQKSNRKAWKEKKQHYRDYTLDKLF